MNNDKMCNHVNKVGYVSNQPDDYDNSKPLASWAVCSRQLCVDQATAWVEKLTKEPAQYRVFGQKGPQS